MLHLVSLTLVCLSLSLPACAQTPQESLRARLMEGRIEPIDSIGVRTFVERLGGGQTDSAEVYFNVRGEPVAWRAWIDGFYHVYWQPYGHFVVNDSTLVALEVFKENRQLLEMLEGLELVEQAAKKGS